MGLEAVGAAQVRQPRSTLEITLGNAMLGAGIGAALQLGDEFLDQRKIKNNPKATIAYMEANIGVAEELAGDAASRSKTDIAKINKLKDALTKTKEFINTKSYSFKAMGKQALIGAGIGAAVMGTFYLALKFAIDFFKDDKKPKFKESQEAQKAEQTE